MQGLPGVGADSDHGFRGRTRLRDPGFETASSVAGTRREYASGVVVMVLANVQFDCWRKARSSSIATGSDTQHDLRVQTAPIPGSPQCYVKPDVRQTVGDA